MRDVCERGIHASRTNRRENGLDQTEGSSRFSTSSPLWHLQHLEQLWLSYNSISSCSGLEKCTKLKILYLGNNKISDLKALCLPSACVAFRGLVRCWPLLQHEMLPLNSVLACTWQEVHKLANIDTLEEGVLYGNPIHQKIVEDGDLAWPTQIIKILPNLKKLDGISVVEWKVKISEGRTPCVLVLVGWCPSGAEPCVVWDGQGTTSSSKSSSKPLTLTAVGTSTSTS